MTHWPACFAAGKNGNSLFKIGFVDPKRSNLKTSGSTPLVHFTVGIHCGVPFSLHAGKGIYAACNLLKKWKFIFQKKYSWLQMVLFENPRVIHPLVPFTFGVHFGVPFSLHAEKGKSCMWPVKKVEIYISKIGLVDCKWSYFKTPVSYTPWSHSLLGSILGWPFPCMQGKGNAPCGLWKKWKLIFQK